MWTRDELSRQIEEKRLTGACWGRIGRRARIELEQELGIVLDGELGEFAENVGNFRVNPFNVLVTGDENALLTAASETRSLRASPCFHLPHTYVKIMDHAGESYLYDAATGRVVAYESLNATLGSETLTWPNFRAFLEWLIEEASYHLSERE